MEDWTCDKCLIRNPVRLSKCWQCGAVRTEVKPISPKSAQMQYKKEVTTGQKRLAKKLDTTIIIALIGGVVTIFSALITAVMAPIAAELIKQTPIPAATSTSESMVSTQVTTANQLPPTDIPPPTSVLSTPWDITAQNMDWRQMADFKVDSGSLCKNWVVFPPNIRPDEDPEGAIRQVKEVWATTNGEFGTWQLAARSGWGGFFLDLTITNLLQDNRWIQLNNAVDLAIETVQDVPEKFNVLGGWECGAGGEIRILSDTYLASDYKSYGLKSISSEFDFFTLQPGEFEIFRLPLLCKSPGIYHLKFSYPYIVGDSSGTIDFPYERGIVCPKSFTVWYVQGDAFVSVENYIWNGQGYDLVP